MASTEPTFTLARAVQIDQGPVMVCEVDHGGCGAVRRRNECRVSEFITGFQFTCPDCGRIVVQWNSK